MAFNVSGTTVIDDSRVVNNVVQFVAPVGNDAARPSSPEDYSLYINTERNRLEYPVTSGGATTWASLGTWS